MIIGVEMNDDITTFLSISLKYFVFTLLIREIEAMVSYIGVGTIVYLLLLIPIVYFEIKYLVYKKLDLENITRDGLLLYFLIFFPLINIFLGISLFYTLMVVAFLLILNKEKTNEEIMQENIIDYYKNKRKENSRRQNGNRENWCI